MSPFSERLARRVLDRKSPLCVGIDPHLDRLAVQWNCGAPDLSSPVVREEMAARVAAWAEAVGREVAGVEVDGERKSVAGYLAAAVPLGASAPFAGVWGDRLGWVLLAAALAVLGASYLRGDKSSNSGDLGADLFT